MSEKVVGYLLLVAGLFVIIFAGFCVYQVFTAKTKPVELFRFEGISLNLGSLVNAPDSATAEEISMVEAQRAKVNPQEIVSAALLNDSSNIAAHMFLMGFVASIGYKIAFLGIQLLRPIVVKAKETATGVKSA